MKSTGVKILCNLSCHVTRHRLLTCGLCVCLCGRGGKLNCIRVFVLSRHFLYNEENFNSVFSSANVNYESACLDSRREPPLTETAALAISNKGASQKLACLAISSFIRNKTLHSDLLVLIY